VLAALDADRDAIFKPSNLCQITMDTPEEQIPEQDNNLTSKGSVPTTSRESNKVGIFSHKGIWIGVGILILLIAAIATVILSGVFTPSASTKGKFVDGGNDCPTVQALSIQDFSSPPQVAWVKARVPVGTSVPVFVPKGSQEDVSGRVADDTIVGFPIISNNPAFKDHSSLKLFYQGNLAMYAVDHNTAYFVYLPNITAWKGEQVVMAIPGADAGSFAPLQDGNNERSYTGFAVDKNHVYFLGDVVPDVEPSTFRLLGYHYALASDTSGNVVFLSAPENTTRENGPVQLSRKVLTPLEALYIKSTIDNQTSTSTPPIAFTQFKSPVAADGAEIRTLTDSGSYFVRRYIPSIYGVFNPEAQHPSICFAAGDYLIRDSLFYKSHALLRLESSKPKLANVDLSMQTVKTSLLPFDLDYYSQIIFDKQNESLWVLQNQGDAPKQSYSLIKLSLDDVIANKTTGKVLLTEQGVDLSNLIISNTGTVGAGIRRVSDGLYNMVTIDLSTGAMNTVAPAGGKSTYLPLFFSADLKKLYYYLSPYEAFDEPSPFVYRHDLSATASSFGTSAELTPMRVESYTKTGDDKTIYYLFETKPIVACNGVDGYYNNAIGSYDTVSGTHKDLFSTENNVLSRLKLDSSGKFVSVEIHATTASTTENGTSCTNKIGNSIETKSIPI
jgi:hypothetical protein